MIRHQGAAAVVCAIAAVAQCAIAHAEVVPVARSGDSLPDGPGKFTSTIQQFVLDRDGRVAFSATLEGTPNGANDDRGLYIWNGQTIVNVAREGQSPPEGNGEFSRFSTTLHMHSAGALVFVAQLRTQIPLSPKPMAYTVMPERAWSILLAMTMNSLIPAKALADFDSLM